MKPNKFDNLLRDELEKLNGLPSGVEWNANSGWKHYSQKYVKDKRLRVLYWSLAASILLAVIAIPLLLKKYSNNSEIVKLVSNATKKSELVLHDGSKIWLNYSSMVIINTKTSTIETEGEVYFELSAKNTYNITSPHGKFTASNCNFNLKTYKSTDNGVLTVASGQVKVIWTSDIILTMDIIQNEQANIIPQIALTKTINTDNNYLAWKTDQLHFVNTPVFTVIDKVEELYKVKIDLTDKEMRYCIINSELKNISLNAILDLLKNQLNFTVQSKNGKYLIKGKGC